MPKRDQDAGLKVLRGCSTVTAATCHAKRAVDPLDWGSLPLVAQSGLFCPASSDTADCTASEMAGLVRTNGLDRNELNPRGV
jgi:hypothetical protein